MNTDRLASRVIEFQTEAVPNAESKPFTWTADPDAIIAAVRRGHQVLESIH